jgi:GT2 family glycosyltransferase
LKLFSIILTNYNQEKFVFDAIDSILSQDYSKIELIITDDCSKTFDEKKIRKYIEKNGKIESIEFVINKENVGTVKTINKALKIAKGDFILVFAADDVLYNSKVISNFVKEFDKSKKINIITSQAYMCDKKLKYTEDNKFVNEKKIKTFNKLNAKKQFYFIADECPFVSGSTAYRRELFDKGLYFDEDFILVEDWSYWLKVTSMREKIKYFDNVSLLHRTGGVSHSEFKKIPPKIEQFYKDIIKVYTKYIIPSLKNVPRKYKYSIIDKYMFYIGYYDQYIPNIYNDNIEHTKLAWKYTNYEKYFEKMQKKKAKENKK